MRNREFVYRVNAANRQLSEPVEEWKWSYMSLRGVRKILPACECTPFLGKGRKKEKGKRYKGATLMRAVAVSQYGFLRFRENASYGGSSITILYLYSQEASNTFPIPEIIYDPSLILSPYVFPLGLIFANYAFATSSLTLPRVA